MKKNRRIMLITNHADDIYCFRKELAEDLIGKGYKVIISCPYGEKLELMKDLEFTYVESRIDRRGTNVIADLSLLIHYLRLISRERPDIVLTYTIKPNIYAGIVCSWLKTPYINNITGLGSVLTMKGFIKKLVILMLREAIKKSSCVFFQNSENMELAKRLRLYKGRSILIPGSGVNIDRFPVQDYPSQSGITVFNYIGRVLSEKGIDDYIEAAKLIKSERPDTEFNIIGFIEPAEKRFAGKLKELERAGIIFYRGNQQDVRPFIARSHCMIHPSKYGEGMSNVLLENASSGRPAITTDIAGCRETVLDGVTGFIYQAGNVNELVEKIRAFLRLPDSARKAMGLNGRRKIEKEFNRKYVVEAYYREIQRIEEDGKAISQS
ncbi:MAG: glycosyltransferase family 4 protein [Oscillospiraceae bacterium]|jgi:glycosyltransferase involved in cell wall biosynthesis